MLATNLKGMILKKILTFDQLSSMKLYIDIQLALQVLLGQVQNQVTVYRHFA